jgi:hypothetical protein
MLQLSHLFPEIDVLHAKYGSVDYAAIYGAGQINNPKLALVFMNPTAKNVSAAKDWSGIRAPWLGTKKVWQLLNRLGLLPDTELLQAINKFKPHEWSVEFAQTVYQAVADQSLYITNIAKCTQDDARPLSNKVYAEFTPSLKQELTAVNPEIIITLGNQVSSVLLNKNISVSNYPTTEFELLDLATQQFKVYPTYYPVGQGMRNMSKAMSRIRAIIN